MSTPSSRRITLDPEALAALEADGAVKFDRPLPPKVIQTIRQSVARRLFGPTMTPTIKQRLLTFPSYSAFNACWAADWWQLKMKEKHG